MIIRKKVLLLGIENEETRKRPERATWHTADMSKSDPPTSADSKLRTKTGARFKRTPHQKQSFESVPPPQKNHEGLRELDLEYDQKSPVSPVSSSIKGESLTNSAEKLRREFHLLHLGLHFAQKGRLTSHDYI